MRTVPFLSSLAVALTASCALVGSADATKVLTASNQVLVLDGESLATVKTIPVGAFVKEFAATPDGARVFLSTSQGVRVIETADWSLSGLLTDRPVQSLSLSPDGRTLYVLDYQVTVGEGDPATAPRSPEGYRTLALDTASLAATEFTRYDERVFDLGTATDDGRLFTLEKDAGTLREMRRGESAPVARVELGPGGDKLNGMYLRLVSDPRHQRLLLPQLGDPGQIWVYDVKGGAVNSWPLPKPGTPVRGVALAPSGERVYLCALQAMYALDGSTGKTAAAVSLDGAFQQVAVSPDGSAVYATAPVYGKGGGVARLNPTDLQVERVVELSEISPYAIVVVDR